jgi:hypothetical protein
MGRKISHMDRVRADKQRRAAEMAQRKFLRTKVTNKMLYEQLDTFFPMIQQNTQKISDLGLRSEALLHTLRKIFSDTKGLQGIVLRWLFKDFFQKFNQGVRRMISGRDLIQGIHQGVQSTEGTAPLPLGVIRERLQTFNQDDENTPVRGGSFRPGFLEAIIIRDLTFSREEKTAFMRDDLCYPEPMIEKILEQIEEHLEAHAASQESDMVRDMADDARIAQEAAEAQDRGTEDEVIPPERIPQPSTDESPPEDAVH